MPTVIVYQNADFVSGLLQEIYQTGILEIAETDTTSSDTRSDGSSDKTGISGGGGINFPTFFKTDFKASGEHVQEQAKNDERAVADRKKFVYSQAFYLDKVRTALRNQGQVRSANSLEDANSISTGDFIEFEAAFTANEANAILDILTPELTAAIAHYRHKSEGIKEMNEVTERLGTIDGVPPVETLNAVRVIHEAKAENQAELIAAVTTAVRTDFRGDKTKEFYATIGQGDETFTAVTVCESEHFVSKDSDRLLDGRFTVLAKVIAEADEDVPILAKNKLLHRLKIEAVEQALLPLARDKKAQKYVDLELKAKIEGTSITVLPVAIYV